MIESVKVSAPLSLMISGFWDLPSYMTLNPTDQYGTIVGAIGQRIKLEMRRNNLGKTITEYRVLGEAPVFWEGTAEDHEFAGPLGPLYAALSHFGVTGISAIVNSPVEITECLGAMEALGLCATEACVELVGKHLASEKRLLSCAYDVLSVLKPIHWGHVMSAFWGGIRCWYWSSSPFSARSVELIASDRFGQIEEKLILASMSGIPKKTTKDFERGCIKPVAARELRNLNRLLPDAVDALRVGRLIQFVDFIRNEQAVLSDIDSNRGKGFEALAAAPAVKKGAFNLVDDGQACWFLGDKSEDAVKVKSEWETRGAKILDVKFSDTGLE